MTGILCLVNRSPSNPNPKPTWRVTHAEAESSPVAGHGDRLRRLLAVRIAASIHADLQTTKAADADRGGPAFKVGDSGRGGRLDAERGGE